MADDLPLGLSKSSLSALSEADDNPREISDERFAALKYALEQDPDMLDARPIIALPSGQVIAGNMRLRALKELGWKSAPVYVADLDEAKRREWMLRDNQEYGDWVPEDLSALIRAHQESEADMALLGFSEPAVEKLLADSGEPGPGGSGGDDGTATEPEVWGVIVDVETEEQQAELIERLADEGFEVRALIPS